MLQCLYQHGVLLFDIIGGGQSNITGERAKVLGRTLIGISENLLDDCCENMFDICQSSILAYEDFQLLYFELFNKIQLASGGSIDFENLAMNEENAQLSNRHVKANENGAFLPTDQSNNNDEYTLDENSQPYTGK